MPRLAGDTPLLSSEASDATDSSVAEKGWTDLASKSSVASSSAITSRSASATPKPSQVPQTAVDSPRAAVSPPPWTPSKTRRGYRRVLDDDDVDDDVDDGVDDSIKEADVDSIKEADVDSIKEADVDDSINEADVADYSDDDRAYSITSSDTEFRDVKQMQAVVELPVSTLISPRSVAVNYEPPLPITSEASAMRELIPLAEQEAEQEAEQKSCPLGKKKKKKKLVPDYLYIDLDQFEVYYRSQWSKDRLKSLHFLGKHGHNTMFFDGILSVGRKRFYVQRVPFSAVPVDKYGVMNDTVKGCISIRSLLNSGREVYYRLGQPSPVYARFYYPYLWVADLGKHFVDYADTVTNKAGGDVFISHFRVAFDKWLNKMHPRSAAVQAWRTSFRPQAAGNVVDFRPAVVAYHHYLWKEASAVLGMDTASTLGFFREVNFTYYPTHTPQIPRGHPPDAPPPTVVTPYVYHTFRGLAVQKYMVSRPGKHTPNELGNSTLLPQGHASFVTGEAEEGESMRGRIRRIRPGDLISTSPDSKGTGSKWSMDFEEDDEAEDSGFDSPAKSDKRWYALVHRVIEPQPDSDSDSDDYDAQRTFEIAWLYAPQHTPCRQTKYPWSNELFLSDHCTCDEEGCFIQEDEISGVHSVEWYGGPDTKADFFIRQTFLHGERNWIQLQLGHIFCQSSVTEALSTNWFRKKFRDKGVPTSMVGQFKEQEEYEVGDTVLAVVSKRDTRSEPYIIVGKECGSFQLRVLLRRNELAASSDAAPNELVYTDEIIDLYKRRSHSEGSRKRSGEIMGRCVVRVFQENATIPTPYNRDGAGNVFYITHRLDAEWTYPDPLCVPIKEPLPPFQQGFDPDTPIPRLRALELFCGCGNLGRGIEDAGATETRCANDIWPVAMHTFMANASSEAVEPFIGSADTLLDCAIRGVRLLKTAQKESVVTTTAIPAPGEIDFISGGSPCQGFSKLTIDKSTPQQFKNRSMVGSFASFVDVYRPKYGILENVVAIAETSKAKPEAGPGAVAEDIFSQLICALLGMGYQLRIMLGNAWFYGTPQKRQRIFVVFAAPGQRLPDVPLPSHGPSTQIMGGERTGGLYKIIGKVEACNWITSVLEPRATAFPFVSSGAATADLADIDDGQVEVCVPCPDHRVTIGITDMMRSKIVQIPAQPFGLGLAEARHTRGFAASLFTKSELAPRVTNAYKRIDPRMLFRTVRTDCVVADRRGPGELHWRMLRPLSVMEMRRAQGMPDSDLLLFNQTRDQWKMVGNAVARQIALALGLSLRAAYLGSLCERRAQPTAVRAASPGPSPKANRISNRIFKTSPYKRVQQDAPDGTASPRAEHRKRLFTSSSEGDEGSAAPSTAKRQRSDGDGGGDDENGDRDGERDGGSDCETGFYGVRESSGSRAAPTTVSLAGYEVIDVDAL